MRKYTSKLIALIPLECVSTATMIALGADEILMGPLAYLTPIDSSTKHALSPANNNNKRVYVSHDELQRTLKLWKDENGEETKNPYESLFEYIHPLVIGSLDRSSSLSIKICEEILSYHMSDTEKIKSISMHLNSDFPSHTYPITSKAAKKIGLKVNELSLELNELLLDLNKLYSQMGEELITDHDEFNYHINEIVNIIEGKNTQIFYQFNKDKMYSNELDGWTVMNDETGWYKVSKDTKKILKSRFFIG